MRYTINSIIVIFLLCSNCTILSAQLGEVEGPFKISDWSPRITLFDNVPGENRSEAVWRETNDDIYFYSRYGLLSLGAATDGLPVTPQYLNIKDDFGHGNIGINLVDPLYPLHLKAENTDDIAMAFDESAIYFLDDQVRRFTIYQAPTGTVQMWNRVSAATDEHRTFSFEMNKTNGTFCRPISVIGNGNIGIGDDFIGISAMPTSCIHLKHRFSTTDPRHDGVKIQNAGSNDYYFTMYVVNASNDLELYTGQSTNPVGRFDAVTGVYSALSDARVKTDVNPIESQIEKIEQLNPVDYYYTHDSEKTNKSLGLIAQELNELYPELTTYSEESDTWMVDYSGLCVVLLKGLQEQQEQIEELQKLVKNQ